MVHKILTLGALILALTLPLPAPADQDDTAQRETIYGWHLMTRQERAHYKLDLLRLQTEQERQAYRRRHEQMMQQRAKRLGIQLPPVDDPQKGEDEAPMSGHIQR